MKSILISCVLVGAAAQGACASAPQSSTSGAATAQVSPAHPGYRRVVVYGEERFCVNDPNIGSHIQSQLVCYTADQLKAREELSRKFMDNIQDRSGLADTPSFPKSGSLP